MKGKRSNSFEYNISKAIEDLTYKCQYLDSLVCNAGVLTDKQRLHTLEVLDLNVKSLIHHREELKKYKETKK